MNISKSMLNPDCKPRRSYREYESLIYQQPDLDPNIGMQMNHSRLALPKGRIFNMALASFALSLSITGVHAQTVRAAATPDTDITEVVVTGTAIKGLNAET